jgi:hypothetical protein
MRRIAVASRGFALDGALIFPDQASQRRRLHSVTRRNRETSRVNGRNGVSYMRQMPERQTPRQQLLQSLT